LEHPRKGIAPPWSSQEPSAHYEMILCVVLMIMLSQFTCMFGQ
jgi:hypothetical protein